MARFQVLVNLVRTYTVKRQTPNSAPTRKPTVTMMRALLPLFTTSVLLRNPNIDSMMGSCTALASGQQRKRRTNRRKQRLACDS